jgi:hypothetical protein
MGECERERERERVPFWCESTKEVGSLICMSPRNDAAAASLNTCILRMFPYEVSVRTEYVIPRKSYVFSPYSIQLRKTSEWSSKGSNGLQNLAFLHFSFPFI